jgi:Sodium/calcium exchanger protein
MGGVRLARGADALADKAGFGHAYIGILLLGLMVSLPEMTFSSVAAARGNAELAVNGLLGGIGMTMIVIAVTDYLVNDEPLSVDIQRPVVLFEGAMVILMLTVAAAGIVAGDVLLPAIGLTGLWSLALVGLYVITIIAVKRIEPRFPWRAEPVPVGQSSRAASTSSPGRPPIAWAAVSCNGLNANHLTGPPRILADLVLDVGGAYLKAPTRRRKEAGRLYPRIMAGG